MIHLPSPLSRLVWLSTAISAALLLATGCNQDQGTFGNHGGGGTGGDAGSTAQGGAGGQVIDEPAIMIRFRAHTEPFEHEDNLSGQTPIDHVSGVRKLQLFVDESDPNPVTIFDFGSDFVEIGYNHGDDTAVVSVPASSVPSATYTHARVVHSHVRYRVSANMHQNGMVLPGEFDNLQVLSDGTMLDGTLRDHGYYEYTFITGGQDYTQTGSNAPLPQVWDTGGYTVGFENGEWFYSFPVLLVVPADIDHDLTVVHEVNMFESFRWEDQDEPSYQPGVFDSTAIVSEPVEHFGANSFWVTVDE